MRQTRASKPIALCPAPPSALRPPRLVDNSSLQILLNAWYSSSFVFCEGKYSIWTHQNCMWNLTLAQPKKMKNRRGLNAELLGTDGVGSLFYCLSHCDLLGFIVRVTRLCQSAKEWAFSQEDAFSHIKRGYRKSSFPKDDHYDWTFCCFQLPFPEIPHSINSSI